MLGLNFGNQLVALEDVEASPLDKVGDALALDVNVLGPLETLVRGILCLDIHRALVSHDAIALMLLFFYDILGARGFWPFNFILPTKSQRRIVKGNGKNVKRAVLWFYSLSASFRWREFTVML